MKNPVITTKEGAANLHIWRTGLSYTFQKGSLYRNEWTNLYFSLLPQPPGENKIRYYDVRRRLPFEDNTFDAVYAMHVIEHLSPREGLHFVQELKRVLKPGGICRLSTPDLEDIARNYFKRFHAALENPSEKNTCDYHWAQLEVFDQLVRRKSGGEMVEAIKAGHFNEDYLKERYGDVYTEFNAAMAKELEEKIAAQRQAERTTATAPRSIAYERELEKIQQHMNWDPRKMLEFNKWMYDRLSLGILIKDGGLIEYRVKDYKSSDIKNWDRYQFDRSNHGDHPIEPSLYAEGRKP